MLYLLQTDEELIPTYKKLDVVLDILNGICGSTLECFVILDDDIKMKCGKKVRGRYTLIETWFPCKPDHKSRGAIFVDKNSNFAEMCTVLVHEWAHHLSQQDHDGMLFNLFKDWMRNEFPRRWKKYVEGRKDQELN